MSLRRRALLGGAAAVVFPWSLRAQQPALPAAMPLPNHGPVVPLRVAYFHNPAFPDPPAGFVEAVLRAGREACPAHFGLQVTFEGGERVEMQDAFAHVPADIRRRLLDTVYGAHSPAWRRGDLLRALQHQIASTGMDLAELWRRAGPHLGGHPPADLAELADRLEERQLAALAAWQPFFGTDIYQLFPAWVGAAGTGRWPWEVVLTNQLVASAEYGWAEFEASLRAGVTNGITTQSPASRDGLITVVTLYPFIGNDPALVALRGGLAGGGEGPVRWATALLLHELGHQLLHLHHPRNDACVMRPAPTLRFAEWVAQHDPARCPIGSEPNMTPGAVKFREIRRPPSP